MRKDIIVSLIIGEISAWLMLVIFKNLVWPLPAWWLLPIVFPLLCAAGMWLAIFLGKRLAVLYQLAKFILVGGMNTLVDLGILNLLIFVFSISSGLGYSAFKGVSFLAATTNSYFWNRIWTFSKNGPLLHSSRPEKETGKFGQFLVISTIGFLINVGVASLVVNFIGPQFGLAIKTWANVGALVSSLLGLAWNFLGYKFVVFK